MVFPNIAAEMERCQLNIRNLAEFMGLPIDTIGRKLSGQEDFTLAEIDMLADLFHCSLDYLIGRNPPSSAPGVPWEPPEFKG